MNQCCKLLEGLYHCLVEQVKNSDYIQGDESPIKVQSGDKKGATHQGYMWVYNDPLRKNVVFEYSPTRSQVVPVSFFKDVNAVVQTHGYSGYNILEKRPDLNITLHACMANEAARNAAMMYSLFACCKAVNIDSYKWLKEVLSVIGDHKHKKLYELLPSSDRFKKLSIKQENK